QVPLSEIGSNPAHLKLLEEWLQSYRPDELFDESGALRSEIAALAPKGSRRMGANPHANGGLLLKDWRLPDFRTYAVDVPEPGRVDAEATRVMGSFLRDVIRQNPETFRIVAPDELTSNRLGAVLEATNRVWLAERQPGDDHLAPTGRV